MRFGIVTDCYGAKTPLEKSLKQLAKSGFRDVEIAGSHLAANVPSGRPLASKAEERLKGIENLTRQLGITVWQLHGPYGGNDLVADSEKRRKYNLDVYRRWIDCCLLVKAKVLIVHIGGRADFCPAKDLKFIRDKNVDALAGLIKHIGGEELRLAIENLVSRFLEDPPAFNLFGNRISDLQGMIQELKSEKIGICLDTGHANIEKLDIPLAIEEAGKDLIATHIHENNGVYDLHMFPFSLRRNFSGMDWFAIFKAFRKIGYPNPLIGECANSGGELPVWLLDRYLKSQKELLEIAVNGGR